MIQEVWVDSSLPPDKLKKEFRKKLMTGGAVLRINPDASLEELQSLFDIYAPLVKTNNIPSLVLRAIADHQNLSEKLLGKITEFKLTHYAVKAPASTEIVTDIEGPNEVRLVFLDSLGDSPAAVKQRRSLWTEKQTPDDVRFLLRRDPSAQVRSITTS